MMDAVLFLKKLTLFFKLKKYILFYAHSKLVHLLHCNKMNTFILLNNIIIKNKYIAIPLKFNV